jgi:AraC-like DNA-binding protein
LWIRHSRKIQKKNRKLYLQIKEQDKRAEELRKILQNYKQQEADKNSENEEKRALFINIQQQKLVLKLREYLLADRNFAKIDIDRNEIVAALGTNRTSLSEAVKNVTGKTLKEYLREIQLEEARQMLEMQENTTMEIIAESCGLTSSTFYRIFLEKYKISPRQYKKAMAN